MTPPLFKPGTVVYYHERHFNIDYIIATTVLDSMSDGKNTSYRLHPGEARIMEQELYSCFSDALQAPARNS